MGFQAAISTCFSKYVTFQGRAHRPEYWWWALFLLLYFIAVWVVVLVLGSFLGYAIASIIAVLLYLAIILPCISVAVRRLHDVDRGGGWFFIQFVPVVGTYWFLFFMVQPGTVKDPSPGLNRFGDGLP
jgi:uncharacterized membrane protein YhaH (DUF805 family)